MSSVRTGSALGCYIRQKRPSANAADASTTDLHRTSGRNRASSCRPFFYIDQPGARGAVCRQAGECDRRPTKMAVIGWGRGHRPPSFIQGRHQRQTFFFPSTPPRDFRSPVPPTSPSFRKFLDPPLWTLVEAQRQTLSVGKGPPSFSTLEPPLPIDRQRRVCTMIKTLASSASSKFINL